MFIATLALPSMAAVNVLDHRFIRSYADEDNNWFAEMAFPHFTDIRQFQAVVSSGGGKPWPMVELVAVATKG